MQNKLIVFEGIDGVGKTSLSKGLVDKLRTAGMPALRFEDIEDKLGGFNLLKPFIKENVPIESSFLFYLASAIYKSSILKNTLKETSIICDRYVFSTIAHHKQKGVDLKINLDELPIIKPDYFFLITLPENTRRSRIISRGEILTPEDKEVKVPGSRAFHFEEIIKSFNPTEIENSGTMEETLEEIMSKMNLPRANSYSKSLSFKTKSDEKSAGYHTSPNCKK